MPHLAVVAAHVEFLVLRENPEVHARVLIAGDEPPAVRRPHERMDAVRVVKLLLRDEIVRVPQAHAAEIGAGHAAARRLPRERQDRLRRVRKHVA